MKYLRLLILVLLFILVGIGAYYLYLVLDGGKSKESLNIETAMPFTFEQKSSVGSKVNDYTRADLKPSGEPLIISGRFQVIDPVQKEINGISYIYALGIVDDKGNFSRIWLTANDYEVVNKAILGNNILMNHPVLLTISRNGVSLDKLPSQ